MMRARCVIAAALMLGIWSNSLAAPPITLTIYGDSTGKGDGALFPWHARLSDHLPGLAAVHNRAVSRQDMRRLLRGIEQSGPPAEGVVVIYDRRNAGETAGEWIDRLHQVVALLERERFLVMPQVPVSGGREDRNFSAVLGVINEQIRALYPENTFSADLELDLLGALDADVTRSDRIHRNDEGQRIEAEFIARWLEEKGWLRDIDAGL